MDEDKQQWYFAINDQPSGPFSSREIGKSDFLINLYSLSDVKFRTNELKSSQLTWREGMAEWKAIFEIDELKTMLQESKDEITPEVLETMPKTEAEIEREKEDKKEEKAIEKLLEKKPEKQVEKKEEPVTATGEQKEEEELFYFNNQENVYKVFNPEEKTWTSQEEKPSDEQIEKLKSLIPKKAVAEEDKKLNEDGKEDQPLTEEELKKRELKKQKRKRAQQNKKSKWFAAKMNTFVYATGLPLDIDLDECKDFFAKCGVIQLDRNTGQLKIKLYSDDNGKPKGDARICYANLESVELALDMLDGSEIRPGYPVKVEQATFEQKGEVYKPRETQKADSIIQAKVKQELAKQKAWGDEELDNIGLKIVVLEGFFTLAEVEQAKQGQLEETLVA